MSADSTIASAKKPIAALRFLLVLVSAWSMLWPATSLANSGTQLNLSDMCQRAESIFRGTVISAVPGTVNVGGGQLPTVTYRLKVDEGFKGEFQMVKGVRVAEVRMLALPGAKGMVQARTGAAFLDIPRLAVGQTYLLLTTRQSAIGMSSPVGLGQGCFRITGRGPSEEAVNAYGNAMLFKGIEQLAPPRVSGARSAGGPMKYAELAGNIRRLVEEQRRAR